MIALGTGVAPFLGYLDTLGHDHEHGKSTMSESRHSHSTVALQSARSRARASSGIDFELDSASSSGSSSATDSWASAETESETSSSDSENSQDERHFQHESRRNAHFTLCHRSERHVLIGDVVRVSEVRSVVSNDNAAILEDDPDDLVEPRAITSRHVHFDVPMSPSSPPQSPQRNDTLDGDLAFGVDTRRNSENQPHVVSGRVLQVSISADRWKAALEENIDKSVLPVEILRSAQTLCAVAAGNVEPLKERDLNAAIQIDQVCFSFTAHFLFLNDDFVLCFCKDQRWSSWESSKWKRIVGRHLCPALCFASNCSSWRSNQNFSAWCSKATCGTSAAYLPCIFQANCSLRCENHRHFIRKMGGFCKRF